MVILRFYPRCRIPKIAESEFASASNQRMFWASTSELGRLHTSQIGDLDCTQILPKSVAVKQQVIE